MTDFDPTQHPRGNALNDGQFVEKTQSGPELSLTPVRSAAWQAYETAMETAQLADNELKSSAIAALHETIHDRMPEVKTLIARFNHASEEAILYPVDMLDADGDSVITDYPNLGEVQGLLLNFRASDADIVSQIFEFDGDDGDELYHLSIESS